MEQNQIEAIELLGQYTRDSFDPWDLAGPALAPYRRAIMCKLLDKPKVPLAQCGVTKLKQQFRRIYAPEGNCPAVRDAAFADWCRAITQLTE